MNPQIETILVVGATGLQGYVACQALCSAGYKVVGVTRNKTSQAATRLAALGVELAQCDIQQAGQLEDLPVAQGIYLILDSMQKNPESEYRQGLNVIRYAQTSGIQRLVYSSVGSPDADNKVAHFGVKYRLEQPLDFPTWLVKRRQSNG